MLKGHILRSIEVSGDNISSALPTKTPEHSKQMLIMFFLFIRSEIKIINTQKNESATEALSLEHPARIPINKRNAVLYLFKESFHFNRKYRKETTNNIVNE